MSPLANSSQSPLVRKDYEPAVSSWQKEIVPPVYHNRGLRWPPDVLPNNLFFFTCTSVAQMRPTGLSAVLHSRHELVVVYQGRARAVFDNEVYELEPGSAHWVKPGEFHAYFGFSEEEPVHWLFFSFDLNRKSDLLPRSRVFEMTNKDFHQLDRVGQLYVGQVQDGIPVYEIACRMAELISGLAGRKRMNAIGKLTGEEFNALAMLKQVAFYVRDRMEKGERIEDLARHLQISEGHLRRTFRELVGVSLGSWLRISRFSRCVQLLEDESISISEIAERSGFESINSFSQAFRKRIGMAPTAYRKHLLRGGVPFHLPGFDLSVLSG